MADGGLRDEAVRPGHPSLMGDGTVGFTVRGRVFESATKRGLGGLVVSAYHAAPPVDVSGDGPDGHAERGVDVLDGALRLGSAPTADDSGEFDLTFPTPGRIGDVRREGGLDLMLTVEGPDDGVTPLADRLVYVSEQPRRNAGRVEHYRIGVPAETVDRLGLGLEPAPDERVAAYRRRRAGERLLADGVTDFHRADIERDVAARDQLRRELFNRILTDPAHVGLPGEVVADGGPVADRVNTVATRAIENANQAIGDAGGVAINLYLTPEDRQRLQPFFDDATDRVATIPESVIRPILNRGRDDLGTLLVHDDPIAAFCAERTFDEACARQHVGLDPHHDDDDGGGDSGGGDGTVAGDGVAALTDGDVPRYLAELFEGAPRPDDGALPVTGGRPDRASVQQSIDDFALRRGPADTPAVHDFHSLHIAFEHVWRILVDENLVNRSHTVRKTFLAKTGLALPEVVGEHWADLVTTVDVYPWIPQEVPAEVASQFEITVEEWIDMSPTHRAKLTEIAAELAENCAGTVRMRLPFGQSIEVPASRLGTLSCERRRQELREQGERLIDLVRHDDYYTLHQTLRDLHERVSSGYEFTVFAADRNDPAVNFGLLNTYELEMTPVNYQVGRLVKTIPLSPKEERTYSTKVTRELTQAHSEAVKNNSTLSREQSSTARVEAEIVAKAQSKTNFGLTAKGSYNIGISKGTATTTFGVDAQEESSKSRKDFHESVLKAAQEYKQERAIEIETERKEGSEYTESGVIVNPNDELSVTYLFYELQRRYRVSEQLHRVTPVVLVAEEVPAPHQITEAWVIAHDWIINRVLLDDSFRPALTYLANKSVGDDFAIRELRANLRHQRNLVDTLRIELSQASHESESRYRALEGAIKRRIGEEEAEATDGWFSDVGDFFGGGGQDPEAAKARELAARDAHRYAVERMEKAEAALRAEMNTLHRMTGEYNDALRDHLDAETRVRRLLVHLRNNIFHYMQAIWSMEPPDQRFLRLHRAKVPVLELAEVTDPATGALVPDRSYLVETTPVEDIFAQFREPGTTRHRASMTGRMQPVTQTRPLVEVADLDKPLGYKGNYAIFPLKEHNALTEFMAAPYVDTAFGAMDPDHLSNVSLDDYGRYVCCLHDELPPEEFDELKPLLRGWLEELLSDPLRNGDEITVPTDSLYIEVLPGAHPLLEDFKLRHRQLDVQKVTEEVRLDRLESLRLASRLLHDERDDPDVDKKVVLTGGVTPAIDVDNP